MSKNKATEVKTTETEVPATVTAGVQPIDMVAALTEHKTVSGVIRYLDSQGHKRGTIAKMTGKRYQHVRNVLTQPLKKPVG